MGAKPSSQVAENSNPRAFSTSSSDVAAFNFLRIPNSVVAAERQRARSLSSVPDSNSSPDNISAANGNRHYDISESPETGSSTEEVHATGISNVSLSRVYAAHSLPSHIWTINGKSLFFICCHELLLSIDHRDSRYIHKKVYKTSSSR